MKLKPNKMQQTLGFRVREPVDWEEVKGVHHLVGAHRLLCVLQVEQPNR